jgi:hypothetical protein
VTEDIRQIRDDLSFMRSLMEDDGSVQRACGVGLLVAGSVFGLAMLRAFALDSGWLHWPEALRPLLPWDTPVLFFLILLPVLASQRKARGAHAVAAISATSRAVWASWAAVGVGCAVSAVSLSIAGMHAAGSLAFTFWGSGWFIAAAAYRRATFAMVALGCYLTSLGAGLVSGGPYEALLMALGLWGLVALPGLMVLKQARPNG